MSLLQLDLIEMAYHKVRETGIYVLSAILLLTFTIAAFKVSSNWIDFWSLIGTGTGVGGVLIAIEQTLQTKTAAVAAENATKNVTTRLTAEHNRRALSDAKVFLSDAESYIESRKWDQVALRLRDLGGRCSQLAHIFLETDEDWLSAADSAHYWANIFSQGRRLANLNYSRPSWITFCCFVRNKINREYGPFESNDQGE